MEGKEQSRGMILLIAQVNSDAVEGEVVSSFNGGSLLTSFEELISEYRYSLPKSIRHLIILETTKENNLMRLIEKALHSNPDSAREVVSARNDYFHY